MRFAPTLPTHILEISKMSRSTLFVSSASLLIAASGAWASGTYYIVGTGKSPSGVSANGSVVAGTAGAGQPYWIWQSSNPGTGAAPVITSIGGISPGNGVGGQAKVSNDGDKISGSVNGFSGVPVMPATVVNQAALYDVSDSTWSGVGGIGWYSGTETSGGWAVSGDGHVLAGLGWSPNQTTAYAIKSVDGGAATQLQWLVPGRSTRANGVNGDGSVIVGWQDRADGFRCACVWTNGVGQRLWYTYPRAPLGEAQACSGDGNWVVGIGSLTPNGQAWRWSQSTGVQLLGELDTTANNVMSAIATDITSDGSTIIGWERDPQSPPLFTARSFIWTQANGIQDLTTWVTNQGVALPTGVTTLSIATAISDDLRTIVGTANNGQAFIIQIDPPAPFAPCNGDVNGDGHVNVIDLLSVVSAWGDCPETGACAADVTGDAQVNINDLLAVVGAWGDCP